MTTVTVLSGPERRRRWTSAEKLQMVKESLAGERGVAEIARRHDVHPNLLHQWRRQARMGVLTRGDETAPAPGDIHFAAVTATPEQRILSGPRAALPPGVIEIELAAGARVRISGSVETATVSATIAALLRGCRR